MKSYLEGCSVPTTFIGKAEIPRLIMGVHPFDGCSYQDQAKDAENRRTFDRAGKVSDVLQYAVRDAGITAAQVDHMSPELHRLHLQAIWETERDTETQIGLIAFILIPLTLDGEMIGMSDKANATFYYHNERIGGDEFRRRIKEDEIIRYILGGSLDNLITPEIAPPFTPDESARFEIDYGVLERYLGFFEGCEILIADPGTEIDLLAMTGRFDLIREYIGFLRSRFQTVVSSVHHSGVTIPLLDSEGIDLDGYVTTVNRPGTFMFPTRDIALGAIRQTEKPVIAIKPLAGGRYLGHKAFEFVYEEARVDASMFGMGTIEQVRETTTAAKDVLGSA